MNNVFPNKDWEPSVKKKRELIFRTRATNPHLKRVTLCAMPSAVNQFTAVP